MQNAVLPEATDALTEIRDRTVSNQISPHMAGPIRTEEEDVVLGQLVQVILDDIWWLIAIAAAVVAIAGAYCVLARPIYSADAHVRVEQADNTSQALTQTQTGAAITSGSSSLPTDAEIEIIKSRGVVAPVVEQGGGGGGGMKLNFSVTPKNAAAARQHRRARRDAPQASRRSRGSACRRMHGSGEVVDVDSIDVLPALEGQKLTMKALDGGRFLNCARRTARCCCAVRSGSRRKAAA